MTHAAIEAALPPNQKGYLRGREPGEEGREMPWLFEVDVSDDIAPWAAVDQEREVGLSGCRSADLEHGTNKLHRHFFV